MTLDERIANLERQLAESQQKAKKSEGWAQYLREEGYYTERQTGALISGLRKRVDELGSKLHDVRVETLRAAVHELQRDPNHYVPSEPLGRVTCIRELKDLADRAERGEWPTQETEG